MGFIDVNRADFGVEPICTVLRDAGVPVAPSTYCPQLRGFACWDAGAFAAVDVVLLDPLRQLDRVNTQIVGGLLLRFAGADECDRAGTELCWVGTVHDGQPFVQAVS